MENLSNMYDANDYIANKLSESSISDDNNLSQNNELTSITNNFSIITNKYLVEKPKKSNKKTKKKKNLLHSKSVKSKTLT